MNASAAPDRVPAGLLAASLLVGPTLRPTLTSVSPLLSAIREATGMTYQLAKRRLLH